MADEKINRNTYLTQNVGDYPAETEFFGRRYVKVDNLRYGTNPHQPAA
jgi:phosphoribosylaminoimidazolecarboxamide formyltransferase/IMP cyclohydrolase